MKLPVAASHLDQPDPAQPKREQGAPRPQAANDDREAGETGERRQRNGQGKPRKFGGKPSGNRPFAGKPGGKKPFRGKRRGNGAKRPAERAA
jgi:ATP-dependent RNA helicase RhlE